MALVPYSGGSGTTMSSSVPLLTGENYTTWVIKVEADLDAAGLWEAVVPSEEAASAVIAKKDKPTRAYLLRVLSDDLLLQVGAKKTAAEIWSSLKSRFVGADRVRAARLATLRGDFERLRMDANESLDAFAGKISGMAARYAGLGSTLDNAAMVKKLFDAVPDRLMRRWRRLSNSVTYPQCSLRTRWGGSRRSTRGCGVVDRTAVSVAATSCC
ncbi:retrotransposon protein [Hordeum vulgare]|nr:retrotransposon protein [Hordeum vulgare]